MRPIVLLYLLAACTPPGEPLDLAAPLGPGEARAGQIRDAAALFGGPSAEGRPGDFKLYNERVQYVVQGVRDGGFMVRYGGMLIDGDLVREPGQAGRDIVEEWGPALGVTRLFRPVHIDVPADGREGGAAVVRVHSVEAPLEFLTGTFEDPDFIDDEGVTAVTTYTLEPDAWLVEVETTLRAGDGGTTVLPGDLLLAAQELAGIQDEGSGFERASEARDWTGFVGHRGDVSALLLAAEEPIEPPAGLSVIDRLLTVAGGFGAEVALDAGETHTYRRFYGVGPDPAALTAERLERLDLPSQVVEGEVSAPDGPVAGARVNLFVDGAPYTLAMTGEDGRFATAVPPGEVRYVTDGQHRGRLFAEVHPGAAEYGPFAHPSLLGQPLPAFGEGEPVAVGRGVVEGLDLAEPAVIRVRADGPFEVRARRVEPADIVDERVALSAGDSLRGWSTTGELDLPVLPGMWDLLVHRGTRFEIHEEQLTVAAGEEPLVLVDLGSSIAHPGYLFGDTHVHAQPSSDGKVAMSHRVVNAAGVGVQVHFGTDHDAVADYRPLLYPLAAQGSLASVVADEVSPSLRGHTNIFPLVQREARAGGAWLWWETLVDTTEAHVANLRAHHPEPFVLQLNHPLFGGFAGAGGWQPGRIADPDAWSDDFQAMELLSGTEYEDYIPLYLDLVGRGFAVAASGGSDAHDVGGSIGLSGVYLGVGFDDPAALTDADVLDVFARRATIVSRGAFLSMDIAPGSTVEPGRTLTVEARSPSWIAIDRLRLYKDGEVVDEVAGRSASFALDATADAYFVVEALGDAPMEPVWSHTPWAMSGAIFVDVDGGAWTPPLGPMVYGP